MSSPVTKLPQLVMKQVFKSVSILNNQNVQKAPGSGVQQQSEDKKGSQLKSSFILHDAGPTQITDGKDTNSRSKVRQPIANDRPKFTYKPPATEAHVHVCKSGHKQQHGYLHDFQRHIGNQSGEQAAEAKFTGANSDQEQTKTSLTHSQKLMNQNYMMQLMMRQQKQAAEGYSRHSVGTSNGEFALDSDKKPIEASNQSARFDHFQPGSLAGTSGLTFGPKHGAFNFSVWSKFNKQRGQNDLKGAIAECQYSDDERDGLPREKKQMHFQSRKQMLRYIENFKLNYKTQLCRNFMDTGACEFNEECAYAHGYPELVMKPAPQQFNKNYKTKMCKQWHEQTPGQCTYGDKCQFVHDEDDLEISTMKAHAEQGQDNVRIFVPHHLQEKQTQQGQGQIGDFGSKQKSQYVAKGRLSGGAKGLGSPHEVASEFDSYHQQSGFNPFSAMNFNVAAYSPKLVGPPSPMDVAAPQSSLVGFSQAEMPGHGEDQLVDHNVGSIFTQSTHRDINLNFMLEGGHNKQNRLEELVRGTPLNVGLVGANFENRGNNNGVFNMISSTAPEALASPQLQRFESRTFQQIEENIQKEILDNSSCDDNCASNDPCLLMQQSTMTNSESPSPKKDTTNEYSCGSLSAASEDEIEFDNVEVNAAILEMDQRKGQAGDSCFSGEEGLGGKLMDRKRLRIFTNITKKQPCMSDKEVKNGSFLQIQVQQCQYLD